MGFTINGFDEFQAALRSLDSDRLAPEMLSAAVPIVKAAVMRYASKHKDTGDLIGSIKATKVKKNGFGYYVAVRPTGKDRKGVRNMEKLAALEYGVDGRQPATPVLTPAIHDAETDVVRAMQEAFDREVTI